MEKKSLTRLGQTLKPEAMTVEACSDALSTLWASQDGPEDFTLYPVVLTAPYDYLPEAIEGFIPVDEDIRQTVKHLNFGDGMELAGVADLFVFIRPVQIFTGERVMTISAEQREDVEQYPNFVPVSAYQSREAQPMEIGYIAQYITQMCGIGHSYARKFGPVLCRVEMAEETEAA